MKRSALPLGSRIGLGEDVLEAEPLAGLREGARAISRSVVGHDTGHGHAEILVVGDGLFECGNDALLLLVGIDVDPSNAAMVVDGDVSELIASTDTALMAGDVAGDAMSNFLEAVQALDVEMEEFAGSLALVARTRLRRLQAGEEVKSATLQDAAYGCRREAELAGDLVSGVASASQHLDLIANGRGCLAWR